MPDTPQTPSLSRSNGHLAMSLLSGASRLLIPYDGLVRTVSGAQRHDQLVIQAITAGTARRAYLKGLGEAYRCRPPAIPAHRIDNPQPVAEHRSRSTRRASRRLRSAHRSTASRQRSLGDRPAQPGHQGLVEGEVVPGEQNLAEDLA